jgi:hypothetical protein
MKVKIVGRQLHIISGHTIIRLKMFKLYKQPTKCTLIFLDAFDSQYSHQNFSAVSPAIFCGAYGEGERCAQGFGGEV